MWVAGLQLREPSPRHTLPQSKAELGLKSSHDDTKVPQAAVQLLQQILLLNF